MFDVEWTRKAYKQWLKLQRTDQDRIAEAVSGLRNFPDCPNIKALPGGAHPYRLRVGRFRVFFSIRHVVKIAIVEEVKKRDEHTY